MKCWKYGTRDHINNISFYLQLTNGSSKLECYFTQSFKDLLGTNTLAYWAHEVDPISLFGF